MTLSVNLDGDLVETHEHLEVNGVRYLLEPIHRDNQVIDNPTTTLATVIDVDDCGSGITAEWIQNCVHDYQETDDVFQLPFLQGVIFCSVRHAYPLSPDAHTFLTGLGMQWHKFLSDVPGTRPLPGPYVIVNGTYYDPLRLYPDTHAAFFTATRQLTNSLHTKADDSNARSSRETDTTGDNHGHVNVAVPSRLRRYIFSKLPLSGIRVAVKDNFDLKGTKTSLCSRSYLQTYPEKSQTAPCIQQILDLGASIVGKTRLCAFAQWEEATEAIEYTSPWSARADGFQSSGGSSNGSGAAIAAYDWLDIAIGSDSKIHPFSTTEIQY
ncbi:MAG: hypothetical protein Q9220_000011 [cf. Caloplaca sp. 1 TL-2023]